MPDLNNKTVLVTGGSRGIGAAIARAIGAAGGEVIVHYARNRDAAEAVRRDIGEDRCHIVQADLAVADEVDRLWSETLAIAPGLNVLINNAGIFEEAPIDAPLEQWRAAWSRVMQVNLLAPADLCRAAINHFRE
ncbi:MAG: SDR family NAD(P)-dependent oxidoreductase, partial [Thermohalobaculum sp.]